MLIWHVTKDHVLDMSQVTINVLGVLEWVGIAGLVAVQYVKERRVKSWVKLWWVVMLLVQVLVVPISLIFSVGHPNLEDTTLEEVLILSVILVLVVLSCCSAEPIDDPSLHSNSFISDFPRSTKLSEEVVYRSLASGEENDNAIHSVEVVSTTIDVYEEAVRIR